jgi:hypothetical protein
MNLLEHPDNDHWLAWREAVARTGYTIALENASRMLQDIERLSPEQFEAFTANICRDLK